MLLDDSWCVVKLKVQTCDPETLLLDWKIQPVNTKTKNQQRNGKHVAVIFLCLMK